MGQIKKSHLYLDVNNEKTKIHYVFGDVMKPQLHGEKCVISVHCVGN